MGRSCPQPDNYALTIPARCLPVIYVTLSIMMCVAVEKATDVGPPAPPPTTVQADHFKISSFGSLHHIFFFFVDCLALEKCYISCRELYFIEIFDEIIRKQSVP